MGCTRAEKHTLQEAYLSCARISAPRVPPICATQSGASADGGCWNGWASAAYGLTDVLPKPGEAGGACCTAGAGWAFVRPASTV
eukprot:1158518-Pelagomonas_calceolata.AAC.3